MASCAVINRGDGAEADAYGSATVPQHAKRKTPLKSGLALSELLVRRAATSSGASSETAHFLSASLLPYDPYLQNLALSDLGLAQVQLAREAERMLLLVLGTSRCIWRI